MTVEKLDTLVKAGELQSYAFDRRDDTGENPYLRLELVFPSGQKLVVIPEGEKHDGTELIGLY